MRKKSLSGSEFTKGKPKKTRQGNGKHSKPKAGHELTVVKAVKHTHSPPLGWFYECCT